MTTNVESQWKEYIGISNVTSTDGITPIITAAIPEFHPRDDGDIGEKKIYKACTEDPIGAGTGGCAKVALVKTVICIYRGFGSTNGLVPCVHRGERVRVFNYGGTEQYYWVPFGKDPGLRKHERIRWYAMDKGEPSVDKPPEYQNVTDFNNYYVEINTNPKQKAIRIHTGVSDGEKLAYDICIYPESCCLEITDNMSGGGKCKSGKDCGHENHGKSGNKGRGDCDCTKDGGNCIRLESKKHWWHIRNVDDSIIDVKKENITIKCKDTITLDAGKHIITKAGDTYRSTVGTTRTENIGVSSSTFCPINRLYTVGADLGEFDRENATVNDNSKPCVAPLTGNLMPGGSHQIITDPLVETHATGMMKRDAKTITEEAMIACGYSAPLIDISADIALHLSAMVTATLSTSDLEVTGVTCEYNGCHQFNGPTFDVQTAHGCVPVCIVFGSNCW